MDTAYNVRKNKTLAYLAELIATIQANSTLVYAFKYSKRIDTSADCISSKTSEEYYIDIKLLVPNAVQTDKDK